MSGGTTPGPSAGPGAAPDRAPAMTMPRTDPQVDLTAAERMIRDDVASAALGMEVTELRLGAATVTMPVTEQMLQGHATCHGGYIFTVADTAFACACNSHGPVTVAASVQIHYIAPAHAGDLLTATARETSRWGRNGLYDVEVHNDRGILIAQFRGTSRTIERRDS